MSWKNGVLERCRARLHDEHGFSLLETVIAITIIFGSLLVLAYTATAGFGYEALARERGPSLDEAIDTRRVTAGASQLLAVEPGPHRERPGPNVDGEGAVAPRESIKTVHDGVLLEIARPPDCVGVGRRAVTIGPAAERHLSHA